MLALARAPVLGEGVRRREARGREERGVVDEPFEQGAAGAHEPQRYTGRGRAPRSGSM